MEETTSPAIVVDARLEAGSLLLGTVAAVAAAYYAGRTGNWVPLMAISIGLAVLVLFVTSE